MAETQRLEIRPGFDDARLLSFPKKQIGLMTEQW
jgi:hypothetical protein